MQSERSDELYIGVEGRVRSSFSDLSLGRTQFLSGLNLDSGNNVVGAAGIILISKFASDSDLEARQGSVHLFITRDDVITGFGSQAQDRKKTVAMQVLVFEKELV